MPAHPIDVLRTIARGARFFVETTGAVATLEAQRAFSSSDADTILDRRLRSWARRSLVALGVRTHVEQPRGGTESIPNGPRLVIANHRSALDIPVVLSEISGSILGRADARRWPVIGPAAKRVGTVFVDRSNKESRAAAVPAMAERLLAGGTVIVFPEGTTLTGDEVRPFRKGSFEAALQAQAWIVPVGLAYETDAEHTKEETMLTHLARLARLPSTEVAMCIGEGFRAEGAASTLASRARRSVQDLVHRARARLVTRLP